MPDKLCGLLGMCRRSGRMAVGFDAVKAEIHAGKAYLVLTASDASAKTVKEVRFALGDQQERWVGSTLSKASLSAAIGLTERPVGVLAVTDRGFAKSMRQLCENSKEGTAL